MFIQGVSQIGITFGCFFLCCYLALFIPYDWVSFFFFFSGVGDGFFSSLITH